MNTRKLIALALVLGLLLPTATSAAAPPTVANFSLRDGSQSEKLATVSSLTGPCAPGAAYDPACDVNHDGAVNVLDVQLAAGHWNQSGTWTSDNDHTHLGQTWIGSNNPLKIQGSFGSPDFAALVLSNSASDALKIDNASGEGIFVNTAGARGMVVNQAQNGVLVARAGNPSQTINESAGSRNGFIVRGAEHNGLFVGQAGQVGVRVYSVGNPIGSVTPASRNGFEVNGAEGNGLFVGYAGRSGVSVFGAGENGLYVGSAGDDGVDVAGNNLGGYFIGGIQVVGGGCTGCLLATFGVNIGDKPLAPGDLVSLAGLQESGVDSVPMVMEVRAASGDDAVVGVVQGWAELVSEDDPRPSEIGQRLVPREGAAEPGQYVTIAYSGLTQVKASGPVEQGSKLVAGGDGAARAQRAVTVEGVELAENASVIGAALESLHTGQGLIWVLLNVQ